MLAPMNHPNVLRVYGVVLTDAPAGNLGSPDDRQMVGMMTEYMGGGSLSSYLAQLRL